MNCDWEFDVSRETSERLNIYRALLEKWNPAINLVAKSTISDAAQRHFADSAQVFDLAPPEVRSWVDLGSGGGFPGMVIAILAADLRPKMRVSLIESDMRKAAFLATVARETGVHATVLPERIETAPPQAAGVVSARALASVEKLLDYVARHLSPGGTALFLKGANHAAEVEAARTAWNFDVTSVPSRTDPQAVILKIEGVSRV